MATNNVRSATGASFTVGGPVKAPSVLSWNAQQTTSPAAAIDANSRSGNARPALVGASHLTGTDAIIVAGLLLLMILLAEG